MTLTNNTLQNRYEMERDGHLAYVEYRREPDHPNHLVIPYVYAPPPLRGTGVAGELMKEVMAIARAEHMRIRPLCSYAALWMQRHPEYDDLLVR